jgi:hypothetical protein
VARIKY